MQYPLHAQERTSPRAAIRFGLNGGGAWQTSDVRTTGGGGTGATFEIPIVENDYSFFGVGLRFRYLWTATYGRDWKRSTFVSDNDVINGTADPYVNYTSQGSYFANHRTSSHNWDMELMLKLNRLRARTGIVAYVWGGVGTMGWASKVDQSDNFLGQIYDYSTITSTTKDEVLLDLWGLRDGDYETPADPFRPHMWRWRFAPSAGIGLGYEFAPWFQLVAEYKVTAPMTDALDATGDIKTRNWKNSDIHHYAGLGLMFGLYGSGGSNYTPPTDPNTYTPRGDKPDIVILDPNAPNGDLGSDCNTEIRARLYNVRNKGLISFTENGVTVNPDRYSYDPESSIFSANVSLRPRVPNTYVITARNSEGSVSRTLTLQCGPPNNFNNPPPPPPPPPPCYAPQVYITHPQGCPVVVPSCRATVYAEVQNVRDRSEIAIYHFGRMVPAQMWDYSPGSGQLTLNLPLEPGDNRLEIVARNNCGEARASNMMTCPTQVVLPTVVITTPGITPYSSPNCVQPLVAKVTGVGSRADITVYLDRRIVPNQNWSYNQQSQLLNMTLNLTPGVQSTVEILASNQNGQAGDMQVISCYQQAPPPIVEIITPAGGNYDGQDCNQRVTARVLNVAGSQDITVTRNGVAVPATSWSYSTFNQILVMDVQLSPGVPATFLITGRNNVGTDNDQATLKCSNPPVQMITICHIPPGNPAGVTNITIPEDQWSQHKAHGDNRGPCATTTVVVCHEGQTLTVTSSALQAYIAIGATQGPCQAPPITICHIPPGNPAGAQTIQVPQSTWPSHQAHGDVQGACSAKMVPICYNGQNMTVSETAWQAYQSLGATLGACPVKTITICHIPPANPAAVTTLTIPEADWAQHQAHGDVQGPCSSTQVAICYKGQTMSISQSALAVFQGLGATQGACPQLQITICHIPPKNPAGAVTMTIPQNEWAGHQAHGDIQGACSTTMMAVCYQNQNIQVSSSAWPALQQAGATQGNCPVAQISICHIPPGNPSQPSTITIPATDWPSHQSHGDVQGPCSSQNMTVCYNGQTVTVSSSAWPVLQEAGAIQGPCPSVVTKEIVICHIPPGNPAAAQTLTIPATAWSSHQAHGDVVGACSATMLTVCYNAQTLQISQTAWPALQALGATQGACPTVVSKDITICHIPPANPTAPQTLTIAQSAWPAHQAHGDVQGPCSSQQITVCYNGQTVSVSTSALAALIAAGAVEGECPSTDIIICHIPPGNPANPQTMTIAQSAWAAHQAHGDVQGACSSTMVTMCFNNQTIQVSQSASAAVAAVGGLMGTCVEPQLTICHIPPGNPSNPQTMSVAQSAWPAHRAHGDVQGPCSDQTAQFCLNGKNATVSVSATQAMIAAGATQGACPEAQLTICHIPPGDPTHPQTMTIASSAWPAHEEHGDVQGACSSSLVTVCYNNQTVQVSSSALPALNAMGVSEGPCEEAVVTICHIPPSNPANPQTITVPQQTWPVHQAHGDVQGPCSSTMVTICFNNQTIQVSQSAWPALQAAGADQGACPEPQITICHIPPGNPANPQTMSIVQSAWASHQAHGDVQGACSAVMVSMCYNGQTIRVSQSAQAALLAAGAVNGNCPEPQISICHIPPGNPTNPQTMNIPQSAWPVHQAHGDVLGECSTAMMSVCYNNQNIEVSASAWAVLQSLGAVEGECPLMQVVICHIPPGSEVNWQTISVAQEELAGHMAHGDTQGPCSSNMITICHYPPGNPGNGQTMTISESAWAAHRDRHSDLMGPCPIDPSNDEPGGGGGRVNPGGGGSGGGGNEGGGTGREGGVKPGTPGGTTPKPVDGGKTGVKGTPATSPKPVEKPGTTPETPTPGGKEAVKPVEKTPTTPTTPTTPKGGLKPATTPTVTPPGGK